MNRRHTAEGDDAPRRAVDWGVLALVSFLSVAVPLPGLGFYSDDWAFLAISANAPDDSLGGVFRALFPHDRMRPVAWLYRAALYRAFGLEPLPYHVVNSLVLLGCVLLLYTVLRQLGVDRRLSFAAAAIYGALPHYTALKFWYGGGFNASLSIALYLASFSADLASVRVRERARLLWRLVSVTCLVASVLAYEIAVPLFLANAAVVWRRERTLRSVPWWNLVALGGLVAYKLATSERFGTGGNVTAFAAGILQTLFQTDYPPGLSGLNLRRAIEVNFGDYGILLPVRAIELAHAHPSTAALLVAAAAGAVVFGRSTFLERRAPVAPRRLSIHLLLGGIAAFALGYAVFLTNRNIQLTPTGVGNRTAAASALGVALVFAGAAGWMSNLVRSPSWGRRLFGVLIAMICASGILVTNLLGTLWTAAYTRQHAILADIRQRFPTVENGSTFFLDGVCRYVGPAPVFEAAWDLAGALQLYYRDPTLQADVVNPTLDPRDDGIYTSEYDWETRYAYGPRVFVYHYGKKITRPLPDPDSAWEYFHRVTPDRSNGCPPGWGGWGEILF